MLINAPINGMPNYSPPGVLKGVTRGFVGIGRTWGGAIAIVSKSIIHWANQHEERKCQIPCYIPYCPGGIIGDLPLRGAPIQGILQIQLVKSPIYPLWPTGGG